MFIVGRPLFHGFFQCCGTMKSWYGSGSIPLANDSDPDPAIFVSDLQDVNKKGFLLITFGRYIYIIFQRCKVEKKSQNTRNQCFSYYFWLMIEGSGSISLTNGSGFVRPKNIWILRIRIRNTVFLHKVTFLQRTVP